MLKSGNSDSRFELFVGVGGLGTGMVFQFDETATLGRNESRLARLLPVRDYCKLHIIFHSLAVLLEITTHSSAPRLLPVGKVGADAAGSKLLDEMSAVGMDTSLVKMDELHPTLLSVCFQYPGGEGGNITTAESAAAYLFPDDLTAVAPMLASAGRRSLVLAAPEVSLETRLRLLDIGTECGAYRVASFVSAERENPLLEKILAQTDLLAINEDEASALSGVQVEAADPQDGLDACAACMRKYNPSISLIVSLGSAGAAAFQNGVWTRVPAPKLASLNTAGAGDSLLGAVLAGIGLGLPLVADPHGNELTSALQLGVLWSALKVLSPHAIDPANNLDTLQIFAKQQGVHFSGKIWIQLN